MNEIENIWSELDSQITDSADLTFNERDTIISNFGYESNLKIQYTPIFIVLIIVFSFVFFLVVKGAENIIHRADYIGVFFVILSGLIVFYFSQRVKVPIEELSLDNSVFEFIKLCQEYLTKTKVNLIIGICLQLFTLSIGLYLIIFFQNSNMNLGMRTAFWGIMFGITGIAIGGGISSFNKHYKGLMEVISEFNLSK